MTADWFSEGALIIAESEDSGSLDYILNEDGTCTCKLCGELALSRTHWYRHKYKVKEQLVRAQVQGKETAATSTCLR